MGLDGPSRRIHVEPQQDPVPPEREPEPDTEPQVEPERVEEPVPA